MKTVDVALAQTPYTIYVGENGLSHLPQLWTTLNAGKNVAIITNPELEALYADALKADFDSAGASCTVLTLNSGETNKTLQCASELVDALLALRFERIDTIVALGGGIVGDVAGFVASITLRGINLIQCPTTLLAQVDASIGGKTGVNHPMGKNLVGCFYQPRFVLSDVSTLCSLPKREISCGLAEVIKYGVIRDTALFDYLEAHQDEIRRATIKEDLALWTHLVSESVRNKAEVVAQDVREAGLRETLNLGHTFGHAIESATHYTQYLHGEAVAIGMKLAADLSVEMGLCPAVDRDRLVNLMTGLGYQLDVAPDLAKRMVPFFANDKKVRHGKVRFILPTKIGDTLTTSDIPDKLLAKVLGLNAL
ncbi:MAG: 3-dehydroquinate synthase [bacterium]|nr:3-dehydroquinate synthase [bacterium]